MEQQKTTPKRRSGILVHPTSFPSRYGIGDLGGAVHGAGVFTIRTIVCICIA